jgi:hypothetical protein
VGFDFDGRIRLTLVCFTTSTMQEDDLACLRQQTAVFAKEEGKKETENVDGGGKKGSEDLVDSALPRAR